MSKKYFLFFIFLLTFQLVARANFNFNPNCVEAYKAIMSLRMNEAKLLVQKEKQQNPQNGIIILLENYIDYFSLLASENKADYEKLKDNRSSRISALEDNDKNSPYYLYSQAEVYLQWSFLKAKFGDYYSSGLDAKKASGLLKDNSQKYPDFIPDKISLALVNVIFGSIPANFKWITNFLGMTGNVQSGIKQLEDLRAELPKTKYSYLDDEIIFFICTIDINVAHDVNNYSKLIGYISGMDNNSLLKVYLQGYVATKTAHNDDVITYLEAAPKSNQYVTVPAINYMLGNAKLNKINNDAAVFFDKYLTEYKGTNLIKDTYLRLAYFYLLQNDSEKYEYYLKLVKNRGFAIDEKDKQALKEANDTKPDIDLLKARFYFDGGYYNKALSQIIGRDAINFKLLRDKIELYYRLGRIYDKLNKTTEALLNYQRAINIGKVTGYYFASNAALRIGNIYEQNKDFSKAGFYYNQVLEMKNHEYQTSIDNDAKAGLKRINK